MAKCDDLIALFDLADRKGFDVTRAMRRDHWRLIDPNGELVRRETGTAAFTLTEAIRFLEAKPDRKA
jgi:hypothetical protein